VPRDVLQQAPLHRQTPPFFRDPAGNDTELNFSRDA
jgi:hypothetical protein